MSEQAHRDGPGNDRSLYVRLLRLRHVHPAGWQRALLVEGMLAVGIVLALADLASAWVIVALPLVTTAMVKGHDLLAGQLARPPAPLPTPGPAAGSEPTSEVAPAPSRHDDLPASGRTGAPPTSGQAARLAGPDRTVGLVPVRDRRTGRRLPRTGEVDRSGPGGGPPR